MCQNMIENAQGLLELIQYQDEVITQQNKIIAKLLNETLEKENYIREVLLCQDC